MKVQVITVVPAPKFTFVGGAGVQLSALMVPALAVGAQVALVAPLGPLLVQVRVNQVNAWPGRTIVGVLVPNAGTMSEIFTDTPT